MPAIVPLDRATQKGTLLVVCLANLQKLNQNSCQIGGPLFEKCADLILRFEEASFSRMRSEGFLFLSVCGWDRVRGEVASVRACSLALCHWDLRQKSLPGRGCRWFCMARVARRAFRVAGVGSCGSWRCFERGFAWQVWGIVHVAWGALGICVSPGIVLRGRHGESCVPGAIAGFRGPVRQFDSERAGRRAQRCETMAYAGNPLICGCVLTVAVWQNAVGG